MIVIVTMMMMSIIIDIITGIPIVIQLLTVDST